MCNAKLNPAAELSQTTASILQKLSFFEKCNIFYIQLDLPDFQKVYKVSQKNRDLWKIVTEDHCVELE